SVLPGFFCKRASVMNFQIAHLSPEFSTSNYWARMLVRRPELTPAAGPPKREWACEHLLQPHGQPLLTALVIFFLATPAFAQDSRFLFDNNGNLVVQMGEISSPPRILGQPQGQVIEPGESASFSVVVADARGLRYQWRFNGSDMGGATGDTF